MNNLGSFEITSGKIIAADPLTSDRNQFLVDNDNATIFSGLLNVQNGIWCAYEERFDNDKRIDKIVIHHNSVNLDELEWNDKSLCCVGVDTGMAGFFDLDHFKNDDDAEGKQLDKEYYKIYEHSSGDKWDSMCIYITYHDRKSFAGTIPHGIVSSTGYGDGIYNVYGCYQDNNIIALKMCFNEEYIENSDDS
ncbi:DUF4241 protein [Fadolivirus algeromassiliense]|jgi:hypothetical protein|uniref:DUF4241 protein n=1 Tax=Fadolivirus FV1/VV64 TaxID=3070911 RepID=A0A7D3QV42_9VIRU|nr:DUF4241 protein [Fadolivirus algeromassiliense]QKF94707.1 DUF4241 protein [Fadolivirus FV1/VV64]